MTVLHHQPCVLDLQNEIPVFSVGVAQLVYDPAEKTLSLHAGHYSATGGSLTIRTQQEIFVLAYADRCEILKDGSMLIVWHGIQALLRWDKEQCVVIELTNMNTSKVLNVQQIELAFSPNTLTQCDTAPSYRQWVHSRDATLDTGRSGVKRLSDPVSWSLNKAINPPSYLYTLYQHDASEEALFLGALPPWGSCFTIFQTVHQMPHGHGAWGFEIQYECQQQLLPGKSLSTSPVMMRYGKVTADAQPLLNIYADLMKQRLPRKQKPRATGWNSWDYYLGAIQRKDMDENTRTARQLFGDQLKYITIDEGYECMWGVWQANWKFPEGLADYCKFVKSQGYKPGIWTAPLMVNAYTPLYRENPDWFISNADGSPLWMSLSYGSMAQLDITHPQVREHLRGIYKRLVADGFEYFKCDFTQLCLNGKKFHDPTVGRADLIRMTFELIRECIGDERYLLSCLAPYESVIGIADAHRTTNDIHNYWSHVSNNVINMFQNLWMQNTIGNTDPDFVIVRSSQTSDDPLLNRRSTVKPLSVDGFWLMGPEMTVEQAEVLALAIHLSGGDMILSDALAKLNEKGIDILRHVLEAPRVTDRASWVNLLSPGSELMPVVQSPIDGGYILGLFNLDDHACVHHVKLEAGVTVIDFWKGESVDVVEEMTIDLPPRSAIGLIIHSGAK